MQKKSLKTEIIIKVIYVVEPEDKLSKVTHGYTGENENVLKFMRASVFSILHYVWRYRLSISEHISYYSCSLADQEFCKIIFQP